MAIITRIERKTRRWEAVWQGDSETVASIVAGGLEAEGIRTHIQGNATPYRASALGLGGTWAILVPGGRAERAREVLRENDEAHNLIEVSDDEGLTATQRSTLQFVMLMLALVVIVFGALAVLAGR